MNKKRIKSLVACFAAVLLISGCGKDFDAAGYTQAMLDLNFQGELEGALKYEEDATEESLMRLYQEAIDQFVAMNITSDIEMNEIKTTEFSELISKIFATMRYDVGEARKTDKEEYEVPVKIEPSDVMIRYQQLLTEDSLKVAQKVKEGGYEGTEEEIQQQVLNDIINHAYELLDVAYTDMQYGEPESVILHIRVDEGEKYSIDEEDMDHLIQKILRLDEIQG